MAAQVLELKEHIRPARLKIHCWNFFSVGRRGRGLSMKFYLWINACPVKLYSFFFFNLNFALKIAKWISLSAHVHRLAQMVNLTPTHRRWNCFSWNKRWLKIFKLFSWIGVAICVYIWWKFHLHFYFIVLCDFLLDVVALPQINKWSPHFGTLMRTNHSSLIPVPWCCQWPFSASVTIWPYFLGHGCLEMYLTFWTSVSQNYSLHKIRKQL